MPMDMITGIRTESPESRLVPGNSPVLARRTNTFRNSKHNLMYVRKFVSSPYASITTVTFALLYIDEKVGPTILSRMT